MNEKNSGSADSTADCLSHYAAASPLLYTEKERERLKLILIDTFGVALSALGHPPALVARRYASTYPSGIAHCAIWGTSKRTHPELAALTNGVLLRCHDFNDLYLGSKSWGHPSDIIPAVLAVAEHRQASSGEFLDALAVGYDVTLALFDTLPAASSGWDYSNLTLLGAVCAIARLSKFPQQTAREALSIASISHFASDEIESGDLNARGDLTMWKRFNAGDAMRQAVYACELAQAGVEGAVRPFEGANGLLRKLGMPESTAFDIAARLAQGVTLSNLEKVVLKRWPVGSRAQSAIQGALEVRRRIGDFTNVDQIRVRTTKEVYEHLVSSRSYAWKPISRETADHSLVYIVGAAILDGVIDSDSFSRDRVVDPERQLFLKKIAVTPDLIPRSPAQAFASTIEVTLLDGSSLRSTDPDKSASTSVRTLVEEKFLESGQRAGLQNPKFLLEMLSNVERADRLQDITSHLVADSVATGRADFSRPQVASR